MRLSLLIQSMGISLPYSADPEIDHIDNDSRNVKENGLFIAASGYCDDVHPFIPQAYRNGCRHFVIASDHHIVKQDFPKAFFYEVDDVHEALWKLCKQFYHDPSSEVFLVGITGTNGKTTTATALYKTLMSMGVKAGLIGTIEYRIGEEIIAATNTTPDVLRLNQLFREMADKSVKIVVMEVSSHALELGRVLGLEYDLTAFTNISQDHLDFHKDMQSYLNAKLKLFDLQNNSIKNNKKALINLDMDHFDQAAAYIHELANISLISYSLFKSEADYYSHILSLKPGKSEFELNGKHLTISMMGYPNVYNLSLVSAILLEMGYSWHEFHSYLSDMHVKGRMESIHHKDPDFTVIIDYAHTPDAIKNLVETCESVRQDGARIITVFGAGGDRDKSKRPLMAQAAQAHSDILVITSDNPRTEDPEMILQDIVEGIKGRDIIYEVISDRKQAIKYAIQIAQKDDIIVIAGKGHEDYQIIGKDKHHFSDREEVLQAFAQ